MNKFCPLAFLFLPVVPIFAANTVANFDGGADSVYTLQTLGDAGGPSIQPTGGNPGGFLQLTNNINGQNNWALFDRTQVGGYNLGSFSFQFRLDNLGAGGADGFSFNFFPTSTLGTTGGVGSPLFTPEDPALGGTLGFGFDTWGNLGNDYAPGGVEQQSNYSEISLFYNGGMILRIDDTRLLPTPFNMKDGAWHTVNGAVNFLGSSVSMTIDGIPIFTNTSVPGLAPFESRIGFAGRTGGANERLSIDNVNASVVPEPASLGLLMLSGLGLASRRRRS